MYSTVFRYILLGVLLAGLCSWGEKAHQKINSSCAGFFPKEIQSLKVWGPILAEHGSDADIRKKDDKNEFVKHFIDIDNYEDFNNSGRIENDFEKACQKYGRARVIKEGTLPWATDSTYRELVKNFKAGQWSRAVLTAADLGHYVGDGFMPLHITGNYNGQISHQTGIHRRFEETMIDRYIDQIQLNSGNCNRIGNVHQFIFSYMYANNKYVNQLLHSDLVAYEYAGKAYNDVYYEALWKNSSVFTQKLLEESSRAMAALIYTAWIEAGKPKIPERPGI